MRICPSCGHENEDSSKFCQSCGAPMEEAAAPVGQQIESTPPPPPPPASQPAGPIPSGTGPGTIELGSIISKGYSEVFADIGGYIVLALVVSIVTGITVTILGGPLFGGALYVIRRKLRGEGSLDIGLVFNKGFEKFAPTFLFGLVLMIAFWIIYAILMALSATGIGLIISVPGGLILSGALTAYGGIGLQLIMEEDMDFGAALSKTWEIIQPQVVMIFLTCLILGILISIGFSLCFIPGLFTLPASMVSLVLIMNTLRYK